jgi:putative transposase
MIRAFRVELDPNNFQRTAFLRHAGSVRFVWNWALAEIRNDYEAKKAATPEGEKVREALRPFDLQRRLPGLKKTEAPWLTDVTAQSLQMIIRNLDKAFQRFFARVKAGKAPGYPRFKKKDVAPVSFQFAQKVRVTSSHIVLPKIGKVRLKEFDYIPTNLPAKTVTITERAGRWYASINVEAPEPKKVETTNDILGIDLGVNMLAVLSDGTPPYENHRYLERRLVRLKNLNRELARRKKGSNRRRKTKLRLSKVYDRIANRRLDSIHKMTSEIVKTKRPRAIVIEDLNVSGMKKNRSLARSIGDAAFSEIRRQLTYKCDWYGPRLVVADRWFPSSKRCSGCGSIRAEFSLSERTYTCDRCGLAIDRDLNAALNLRSYGEEVLAGGTPVTARRENRPLKAVRPKKTGLVEARTDQRKAS